MMRGPRALLDRAEPTAAACPRCGVHYRAAVTPGCPVCGHGEDAVADGDDRPVIAMVIAATAVNLLILAWLAIVLT